MRGGLYYKGGELRSGLYYKGGELRGGLSYKGGKLRGLLNHDLAASVDVQALAEAGWHKGYSNFAVSMRLVSTR